MVLPFLTHRQVKVHGLPAAVGMVEALCEQRGSPLFDRHSCMATMGGEIVPLDRSLVEGDRVDHYHLCSGG